MFISKKLANKPKRKFTLKITHKLATVTAVIMVFSALSSYFIYTVNKDIGKFMLENTADRKAENVYRTFINHMNSIQSAEYEMITRGISEKNLTTLSTEVQMTPMSLDVAKKEFKDNEKIMQNIETLENAYYDYKKILDEYLKTEDAEINMARIQASPILAKNQSVVNYAQRNIDNYFLEKTEKSNQKVADYVQNSIKTILVISCLIILLPTVFITMLGLNLKKGVNLIHNRINHYKNKDFTYIRREKNRNDEFGEIEEGLEEMAMELSETFKIGNNAAVNLFSVADEVSKKTENVRKSVEEVLKVAKKTEGKAISQYQETTSISSVIEEITVGSEEAQNSVLFVRKEVENMNEFSKLGKDEMVKTNDIVKDAKEGSLQLLLGVEKIKGKMEEVTTFINGINYIVEQTNLLALNASIEAARAGEHGRGFMVVAEEVRKLSKKTEEFSRNITEVVGNVKSEVNGVTISFESFTKLLNETKNSAEKTTEVFIEISNKSESINKQVGDVSTVVGQITVSLNEIVNAVTTLVDNASGVKESMVEITKNAFDHNMNIDELEILSKNLTDLASELREKNSSFKTK